MYSYKNNIYELINYAEMKDPFTREWKECAIYVNASGKTFVRELNDFISKFKKVVV